MSASPGKLGGLRGLVTVRSILGNIGAVVLPKQIAIAEANNNFTVEGRHQDARLHEAIDKLGRGLAEFLKRLA